MPNDSDRWIDDLVVEMWMAIERAAYERDNSQNIARRNAAGIFVLCTQHRLRVAEADQDWLRELGIQP